MEPFGVLAALLGLVLLATGLGAVWRARTGRVRLATAEGERISIPGLSPFTSPVTLLQFSTEVCAPCRATSALLAEIAGRRPDAAHVEIDVTRRPDIVSRFNLLQSPTTFVLDRHGSLLARIGGTPRREELAAVLDGLAATNRTMTRTA